MGRLQVTVVVMLFLAGCSGPPIDRDAESRALRHMLLADTLQRASSLPEAMLEYDLVTELYPKTSYYPLAVRKTALLYANPGNPVANDSAALYWLGVYRQLSIPPDERQTIDLFQTLITKLMSLKREFSQETIVADSLAFVARRQSVDLTSRARRIQDLELQLQQANDELTKLKEVDVRLSRSREKK